MLFYKEQQGKQVRYFREKTAIRVRSFFSVTVFLSHGNIWAQQSNSENKQDGTKNKTFPWWC